MPIEYSCEQQRAIDHRGSHLQIVACAGSGKTEVISRRVSRLLTEGAQPEQIVAFTFTERAAAALKQRVERHVSEDMGPGHLDRLNRMFVGTIHSYCLRLLQQQVPRYAAYDVLDEHLLAGLVSREYSRLGLREIEEGGRWRTTATFLRNVDVVDNELLDPDDLGDTPFRCCYERFRQMLAGYRLLTYGQFIALAVSELRVPEFRKRIQGQLRHLIVDEYQDINPAQEELIRLLAHPPVELCVVGDDDQCIYQWRGSDVSNILTFTRRHRKKGRAVVSRPVSVNHRSRPAIIEAANRFSASIQPRLKKAMKEHREGKGEEVCCWLAETPEHEAEVVADTVEQLKDRGFAYRDIAVLLRSVRTSSSPFLQKFRDKGIPYRCAGRTGLFLDADAQQLGRTYAWLIGERWKESQWEQGEPVELTDLVGGYKQQFSLSRPRAKAVGRYLESWRQSASDTTGSANLIPDYYLLLRLLGVHEWDLRDGVAAARAGTLARFSHLLADFESVTRRARPSADDGDRYHLGTDRGEWLYRRLYWYIQYYALGAYEGFPGEDSFDYDAVEIMTVHQAKGLEWPVVFVPALSSLRFPSSMTGRSQTWLVPGELFDQPRYGGSEADERRLFYVAMTRARDALYLSSYRRMRNRSQPSPFLMEIAEGEPPRLAQLPMLQGPDEAQESAQTNLIQFSDLAAFATCPYLYRLRALLGFQPPIVQELGYGKAVHHILRRVAEETGRAGGVPDGQQVDGLFDEEFYLPYAGGVAQERMRQAAQRLVKAYVSKYSADLMPVWQIERPFELHLDGAIVSGRADVILDREGGTPGSTAILDYKTSISEASTSLHRFQLAVYAAAGRGEGMDVRAAYLHNLGRGQRLEVAVGPREASAARQKASRLIDGIRRRGFRPRKGRHCQGCDVRYICRNCPERDLKGIR